MISHKADLPYAQLLLITRSHIILSVPEII